MMDIENTHTHTVIHGARHGNQLKIYNTTHIPYTLEHDITYSIFANSIIEHTKETLVFHRFIKIFSGSKAQKANGLRLPRFFRSLQLLIGTFGARKHLLADVRFRPGECQGH